MDFVKQLMVAPGRLERLSGIDPDFKGDWDKARAEQALAEHTRALVELQYRVYAEASRSVLVVLQGLDAAGKDGAIRHVFGPLNPQGMRTHAFKAPSAEEASHDFLWRAHARVPGRGELVVFNRSYYEDVLITRVRHLVPRSVWSARYDQINAFEANLAAHGTLVLKFFLHISADEQLERFGQRLQDPERNWKISETDYTERELWGDYQKAYADAIERTSTPDAPWFVVPANSKWFRNLAVAAIVRERLESLGLKLPPPRVDLAEIRKKYHAALKKNGN